ncbi:LOW QUALITY PROTEIN: uncharacterized protein [Palaemon carinicauda]|uniref:LOW QUALITY PROTEIN: uncharacterized protein n=1 Tax=Palaemon carinicauda TaxID=392227 RepID=UPI0035B67983
MYEIRFEIVYSTRLHFVMVLDPRMQFALVTIATIITNTETQEARLPEVKMYSLQKGLWSTPMTNVFVRYDFPKPWQSYSDITICYRIRVERFSEYTIHLSYALSHQNANEILFYNMATELYTYLHDLKQTLNVKGPLEMYPETWNHFCHRLSRLDHKIYWQGQFYGSAQVFPNKEYLFNGTLIIGQEQDSLGGTFASSQILQGDIVQLSIWDRHLSPEEIQDLANCKSEGRGNIFSLDTAEVNKLGPVSISSLKVSDLCKQQPHYLVLPERRTVTASLVQCHLLNASMVVPSSKEENSRIRNLLAPFMDACSSTPWKIWLGITDEMHEGVWIDLNGDKPVEFENFVSPYPYGGRSDNCAALLPDGTWGDAKCSLKKCSACHVQPSKYLYLRGLCFDNEHETRFRVEGYIEGRPLFRGYYDLLVMWNQSLSQWLLTNTVNTTIASMSPSDLNDYPLGQNEWTIKSLICGTHIGAKVNLSLSPCMPDHFMCYSGECIKHQYRCNLRFECEDGSDEDDCDVVHLESGYRSHLPPPGLGNLPLQLALNFTLARFVAIDIIKMSISVDFQVSISWEDNRLSFSHLESTKNKAILTRGDVSKIWIPRYRLLSVEGGLVQLLEQEVLVNSANNPRLPDFNAVKMDLMYPGAENQLILIEEYTANFACSLQFYAFPFDVQVCSISLRLPSSYEDFVAISDEKSQVSFTGPQELALFMVGEVRKGPDWGDGHAHIEFVLKCHGSSVVLSFFLPCLMLLLVSWGSLFINWDAFALRVMLSFGTLLLFYLLRLTLISSTPVTMAVKFLDVWVLITVLILFVNVLVHIFLQDNDVDDYYNRTKPLLMRPAGGAVMIARDSSKSQMKPLHLYRMIILPVAVVTFNIIFWAMLFILR